MSSGEAGISKPDHKGSIPSRSVMAFLQARMGSSRLPGKVLMPIRGYTVLERAIGRLRAAPVVDNVAVLTTRLREDDAIVEEAYRLGVVVYRGSESDVLARFYEASREFQPEVIIRATADNPLIEIGSIDRIVKALREENLDYCMERNLPYGAATEAITVGALAKVHRLAQEVPHREHVTLYIKEHPECFCTSLPAAPEAFRYPQIRLTIDTPEDFIFMDQLIRRMPETRHPLPLSDYLPFCLKNLHEGECKALA